MITNCAIPSIEPYMPSAQTPWDNQRAVHLYRRTMFGASIETIKNAVTLSPKTIVDSIIDEAKSLAPSTPPVWASWTINDYSPDEQQRINQFASQYLQWGQQWVSDMKSNGLRDRMSWFWHNHFVTKLEKYYCPSWLYRYHYLLQKYALGNFKEFVKEIGTTPAMLIFLDGVQNTKFQPNENYARELYEIFTLGVDNGYTQQDIVNTARALTGWNNVNVANFCGDITFNTLFWDSNTKTIFGKTGNWNHADVIDILFSERAEQISIYITTKIYKAFVNPSENEDVIKQLAAILRNNNFEIAPLMKAIFGSEHFFDKNNIGTIIPGHIEYFTTFICEMGYSNDDEFNLILAFSGEDFDQRMFNPTDVAGWPGNRSWINSATLPYRVDGIRNMIGYFYLKSGNDLEHLRKFAIDLVGSDQKNPYIITQSIVNHFLPNGLQHNEDYNDALLVFKGNVPENYFESGAWNLLWEYVPIQVYELIIHISHQPEFQLK